MYSSSLILSVFLSLPFTSRFLTKDACAPRKLNVQVIVLYTGPSLQPICLICSFSSLSKPITPPN